MPPIPRVRLLLPEGEEREFTLQADYFEGQIDLKAFCASQSHHPIISTSPLILEPQKGSFVFLSRFGGVVFWNCPEALISLIHEELRALPMHHLLEEQARDFLMVKVGAPEDSVGFSEVQLREFSLEKLGIVSLALAQSVALDHFEGAVSRVDGPLSAGGCCARSQWAADPPPPGSFAHCGLCHGGESRRPEQPDPVR